MVPKCRLCCQSGAPIDLDNWALTGSPIRRCPLWWSLTFLAPWPRRWMPLLLSNGPSLRTCTRDMGTGHTPFAMCHTLPLSCAFEDVCFPVCDPVFRPWLVFVHSSAVTVDGRLWTWGFNEVLWKSPHSFFSSHSSLLQLNAVLLPGDMRAAWSAYDWLRTQCEPCQAGVVAGSCRRCGTTCSPLSVALPSRLALPALTAVGAILVSVGGFHAHAVCTPETFPQLSMYCVLHFVTVFLLWSR